VLTTLAQLIDADCLREADRQRSKASAPGIDGVTAQASAESLDEHLGGVHECLGSGREQAAPVERGWIAQADGGRRPLGQPAIADKMVQRAVARLLAAMDAQDVHDGS
jgi:RNA-directed DNA polymerase